MGDNNDEIPYDESVNETKILGASAELNSQGDDDMEQSTLPHQDSLSDGILSQLKITEDEMSAWQKREAIQTV